MRRVSLEGGGSGGRERSEGRRRDDEPIAALMNLTPFKFLTSHRVPEPGDESGETETFTSQRSSPCASASESLECQRREGELQAEEGRVKTHLVHIRPAHSRAPQNTLQSLDERRRFLRTPSSPNQIPSTSF